MDLRIKTDEPLYSRVVQRLRTEIESGVYQDADRLPSEDRLSGLLGVSRATLRQALQVLEQEGWISRVQGVGTLILRHKPLPIGQGMERLQSYTEYVSQFGLKPGTARAEFVWDDVHPQWESVLPGVDGRVGCITRVRTADGERIMISKDVIPEAVLGADFSLDAMGESLFAYLAAREVRPTYSEMTITAAVADSRYQEMLGLEIGEPLLVIKETYYSARDEPLLWSRNIYRVTRWTLKLRIVTGV